MGNDSRAGVAALGAHMFHLEVDGLSCASFTRCDGLGVRREVLAYCEGGAVAPRIFRGRELASSIVLERGVFRDTTLWSWYLRGDPRDGAVVLLGRNGEEVARWRFLRGWPSAWTGPSLDANEAAIALESLEIAHEGIEWVAR